MWYLRILQQIGPHSRISDLPSGWDPAASISDPPPRRAIVSQSAGVTLVGDLGEPLISAKQWFIRRTGVAATSSALASAGRLLGFQVMQFCLSIHLCKHQASSLVQGVGLWIYPLPCWRCETVVWTSTSAACRAKRPVSSASGPTRPPSNAVP